MSTDLTLHMWMLQAPTQPRGDRCSSCCYPAADKFLRERQYFRDGRLDRDGLVAFIKEVKNYPGLTDEDAAVLAASK